ncbi:hypothetical protein ALC57_11776, partial [Trachymyrmex cornetzi]
AKNAVGESASAWQVVAVASDDISIGRRAAACGSDNAISFVPKGASGRLKLKHANNDTRRNDQDIDNNQMQSIEKRAFDSNLMYDLDLVMYFSDQDGTTMEEFVNIRARRTKSLNECGILRGGYVLIYQVLRRA